MGRIDKQTQVPEPTLRRLPWYLAHVKLMQAEGLQSISSTAIAKCIGIDSALVAKDLSYVDISGKTRVGYSVDLMVSVLESFLGFTQTHKAYVFGVGNLGAALLADKGLSQYGMEIVAGFDVDPAICGTTISGTPIYHLDELDRVMQETPGSIGVLTVPISKAQEVTDIVVGKGIRAVWNFTPFRIKVPQDIVVQNTSMYAHLAVMFNRLKG
ncbi:MAG: redox-sensing transcriptional repressor Rex [Porphyromonas sp.]|nr:redox-sensing transcriptional repressor Rex [Porphyromonas sp.]